MYGIDLAAPSLTSLEKGLGMSEQDKVPAVEAGETKSRRAFVKTAAQVAVTAPAVALLLSASSKPAAAQVAAYDKNGENASDQGGDDTDGVDDPLIGG
jgi:hypothetical protein